MAEPIRWGILGTARIARNAFLPALAAAGGGMPYVIAGRDLERARHFAAENGIQQGRQGYETVIGDDRVDAVYIPLPNELHAEWTIAALEAGKAVLCEKPLCSDLPQAERVLGIAESHAGLLWEAFVWPFRPQTRALEQILDAGEIGEAHEVQCSWHHGPLAPDNIRLSGELGGGALLDIGCYPISLARWVFRSDAEGGIARAVWTPSDVDIETSCVLEFSGNRKMTFSGGMRGPEEQVTRIIGSEGFVFLSHAYHPSASSCMRVHGAGGSVEDRSTRDEGPPFSDAIRHIHRVLHGEEEPRHLATAEALGNAVAIDALHRSARSGCYEQVS